MADSPHIWDDTAAQEDISYLKEMVTHQASIGTLLGALSIGALLSIPLGLGVGAIPILLALAGESIAALFIPSSPVFRQMINRRKKRERREAAREHLSTQLQSRVREKDPNWATYERMRGRLSSLQTLAESRSSGLTDSMVQRLDDSTVDYLGLWLGWLAMRERWDSVDERTLKRRIQQLDAELSKTETSAVDRHHLSKARADLQGILERRQSLWGRAASVEAAMLAMADTFEEVYQRIMSNPNATGAELNDAVERMRVEEQLDLAVESELSDMLDPKKRAAARAKQALR